MSSGKQLYTIFDVSVVGVDFEVAQCSKVFASHRWSSWECTIRGNEDIDSSELIIVEWKKENKKCECRWRNFTIKWMQNVAKRRSKVKTKYNCSATTIENALYNFKWRTNNHPHKTKKKKEGKD